MSEQRIQSHSGGCQCGAVRYRIRGPVRSAHLCHCRMCQKAAGSYFMALGGTTPDNFEITRGAPSWFKSSAPVSRGFCAACGTPLFFRTDGGDWISVTLGSLDDPASAPPRRNDGVEAMMPVPGRSRRPPWYGLGARRPARRAGFDRGQQPPTSGS